MLEAASKIKVDSRFTMNQLRNAEIDRTILGTANSSCWSKVSLIIFKAAEKIGCDLPEGDAGYELIAKRVELLVQGGRLLARGDIVDWRHSEVRRPK